MQPSYSVFCRKILRIGCSSIVVRGSDPINMKTIASPPTFLFVVGKFIAINAVTGLSFYLSAVVVIMLRKKAPF